MALLETGGLGGHLAGRETSPRYPVALRGHTLSLSVMSGAHGHTLGETVAS
jgi:hypothetical protein